MTLPHHNDNSDIPSHYHRQKESKETDNTQKG